jgi:NADPH:quinone reductase-like Zn-dependent oxidoreductase
MQAYRIYSGRNENALERFELKTRSRAAHEVRIRVRAVSLNYRDLMIERGEYPVSDELVPIAVADGAGEVVAVGAEVTRFRERDRVAGISPSGRTRCCASRTERVWIWPSKWADTVRSIARSPPHAWGHHSSGWRRERCRADERACNRVQAGAAVLRSGARNTPFTANPSPPI